MATKDPVARPGNPHGAAPGAKLTKVTLMIDEETFTGLEALERAWGPNVRGRRSAVIRDAIRAKVQVSRLSRK